MTGSVIGFSKAEGAVASDSQKASGVVTSANLDSGLNSTQCAEGLVESNHCNLGAEQKHLVGGVFFDGTNDYLQNLDIAGASSSIGELSFSLWVNHFDSANKRAIIDFTQGKNSRLKISIASNFRVVIELWDFDGGSTYKETTISLNKLFASWNHLFFAFSSINGVAQFYLNGENFTPEPNYDGITDLSFPCYIGSFASGFSKYFGGMSEIMLWQEFIDFSAKSNRRKLISADGDAAQPIDVGADGSLVTGSPPLIYLNDPAATFNRNKGSGDDFKIFGGFLDLGFTPSITNPHIE